jgi:ketosteroid isomerase-like protein
MRATILLYLTATACSSMPSLPAAGNLTELLDVRERVWRAWFGNDHEKLCELLPADFVAIDPEGGVQRGRQHQLDGARAFAASGGTLLDVRFPETEVQWFGDLAVVYTTFVVDFAVGGEKQTMQGRASEVFERRHGRWVHPGWHMDTTR